MNHNKFTKIYGMPYMGSKNTIAEEIIDILPTAEYFVDLFGGGGALSHCAYCSKKYKKIIYNEIDTNIYKIFRNACNGVYKTFKWLSKEEYDKKLSENDIDLEMILFSFGYNIQKGYFTQKKRENLLKAYYEYIFNNNLDGLKNIEYFKSYKFNDDEFNKNNILERKQFIKQFKNIIDEKEYKIILEDTKVRFFSQFQRILALSEINNIEFYNTSYENVVIPDDSVVICDIPYRETEEYSKNNFDYEKFYDWCLNNKRMVFINEYSMPDDFYLVKSFSKMQILSSNINSKSTFKEKLFCNRKYEPFGINDLF